MESSLDSTLNWLNIIFKIDFIEYLELDLLKEVSLISRIVREKLKPHLFRNLELSTKIFEFKITDNVFIEYINQCIYPEFYNSANIDNEHNLGCLCAEKSVKDFAFLLKDIKKFAKSLKFDEAKKSEYYFFPVINIFNNLTVLRLNYCVAPLAAFNKLGESLLNLKRLEMVYVYLYKLPTYNISSDQVTLPSNLTCLDIQYCTVAVSNLTSNPYEFLLSQDPMETYISLNLPIVSLSSLKKLTFLNYEDNYEDNYSELYSFLAINTNLEYLKIKSISLNLIKQLKSLKCLEFDIIAKLDTKAENCALDYISKLSIGVFFSGYYESVKNLCLLCSNLEELSFYMGHGEHQQSIDNFLIPLISTLPLLKTLKLMFGAPKDNNLNFTNIPYIESLLIETEGSTLLNLSFDTCTQLKKIRFTSYIGEVNTQEFKDKFKSYSNWTFKFAKNIIKGYKIN
ncbi:hypothetical protein CONCODRAFT_73412 [Conidiobolus coronatus NRRL 28638]|uniref:F-box domain-containing protein n=1 Tax=Conidiobolus coronatus (strain ATCC 28846 / CBS 209.66 / NRRL 28638) TaxID=796925 RepID=A0A137NVI4_CONC2|nr:hypothetical protein CONCODRAFT_73412 [Conidiobolus coronatus NRRL 28638]|eukprot:KXN66813.1 hypothetical protein CONCODRAFT_73412 [Conidiobolus coronatus NRRL 28638]